MDADGEPGAGKRHAIARPSRRAPPVTSAARGRAGEIVELHRASRVNARRRTSGQHGDRVPNRDPAALDHLGVDAEIGVAVGAQQFAHRVGVAHPGGRVDLRGVAALGPLGDAQRGAADLQRLLDPVELGPGRRAAEVDVGAEARGFARGCPISRWNAARLARPIRLIAGWRWSPNTWPGTWWKRGPPASPCRASSPRIADQEGADPLPPLWRPRVGGDRRAVRRGDRQDAVMRRRTRRRAARSARCAAGT